MDPSETPTPEPVEQKTKSIYQKITSQVSNGLQQAQKQVMTTIDLVQQKIEEQFQGPPILIQVCDPMSKDSGFQKHTIYNVKGEDKNGQFDVYRRFNDFVQLRDFMVTRWPGCFIPAIPEKQIAQGNDQQVVQERKRQLDFFCKTMALTPALYYSEEFNQIFLRGAGQDIGKTISILPAAKTSEIVERYQETITKQINQDQGADLLVISTFQGALRRNIQLLKESYVNQGLCISQSRRFANEQKTILLSSILPEYESKCQIEYVGGIDSMLVMANPANSLINESVGQLRDQYRSNPHDLIYDLMRIDLRDSEVTIKYFILKSMLFAINQREGYLNLKLKLDQKVREDQVQLTNLTQGKQTFTTTVLKNKDETQIKLEQRIKDTQIEIQNITNLVDLMTPLLGSQEIPKFKKARIDHYKKVMSEIRNYESKQCQTEINLWEEIKKTSQFLKQMN